MAKSKNKNKNNPDARNMVKDYEVLNQDIHKDIHYAIVSFFFEIFFH